jgi:hypothetical protein
MATAKNMTVMSWNEPWPEGAWGLRNHRLVLGVCPFETT